MVRDCPLSSTAGYLLLQGLKATLFELQFMLQVDHLSLQLVDLNGRRPHRRRCQRGMWRCRLGRGAHKPLTILLLPKRPPASLGHLTSQHPPFTSTGLGVSLPGSVPVGPARQPLHRGNREKSDTDWDSQAFPLLCYGIPPAGPRLTSSCLL